MKDVEVQYAAVPDYPGYRVGDDGTVWTSKSRTGRGGPIPWRELRQKTDRIGRKLVSLSRDGVVKCFGVGVLVLTAFVGPSPPGTECCHFPDRDPANNRIENLRWDTHAENTQDALKHGTFPVGGRCNLTKLTEHDVREIIRRGRSGEKRKDTAAAFGIHKRHVFKILRRETWTHLEV